MLVLLFGTQTITAEGVCEGEILHAEHGTGGFGYDALFFSHELGKSFGEAAEGEKNLISHRARAARALLGKLGNYEREGL
jgi:XTP/dITP diphosphohydrolase